MDWSRFPVLDDATRRAMLQHPGGPVRVVIDTDTANEIDDQFALAWAFLSQDVLEIEGLYAEPYSFGIYRPDLLRTAGHLEAGEELPPDLAYFGPWVRALFAQGRHPRDLTFVEPADGMEASYGEILKVGELMGEDIAGRTFRGATRYLSSYDDPVESEAVHHLIERAMEPSDRPLHVMAIGVLTNVASALLIEPRIAERIVVSWTAGYPTAMSIDNHSFNMEQDMLASQLLFRCGVPLLYHPGYYIGAQLKLSLPEVETWIQGRGRIGDYLHHLYTHNPLFEQRGIEGFFGRTWVIWDLVNIAWLLDPRWMPSRFVPAPRLGDDRTWSRDGAPGHEILETYEISRDAIFRDFFAKLDAFARQGR
jgi:purine nucleosidase